MTRTATRRRRMILSAIAAGIGAAAIAVSANPFSVRAQDTAPEAVQPSAEPASSPPTAEAPPPDPAAELAAK
ncbi:hypothetical protein ACWGRJ_46890, partial [Bradyrhizobium sp. Lot11]